MRSRHFIFGVLGAIAVLVSACDRSPKTAENPTSEPTPEPTPTPDPLATRVGFFAPLSGAQASFGQDAINGARLAVDEINAKGGIFEHPLELIVKDTRSRADETTEVVRELIDSDQVALLIGEIATDRSLVAAPLAQESGVPMITPGSTSEKVTAVGDYVFRACYTDAFQAKVMADFSRSINVTAAAILYDPSDPYSAGLAEIFKSDFESNGGKIVAEEFYRKGDNDFSTQLNAIKAKRPEIIFLPSYFTEAPHVIRQARQAGLDMPFLGTDGWDSPDLLKIGGEAVNNCYFSSHFAPEAETGKTFVTAYTKRHQTPPPPLAALAYDTVQLSADALRRAGAADANALREALASTENFSGVTGRISMDKNRNPTKPGIVIRVQDGKFNYLETVQDEAEENPPAAAPSPEVAPADETKPTP